MRKIIFTQLLMLIGATTLAQSQIDLLFSIKGTGALSESDYSYWEYNQTEIKITRPPSSKIFIKAEDHESIYHVLHFEFLNDSTLLFEATNDFPTKNKYVILLSKDLNKMTFMSSEFDWMFCHTKYKHHLKQSVTEIPKYNLFALPTAKEENAIREFDTINSYYTLEKSSDNDRNEIIPKLERLTSIYRDPYALHLLSASYMLNHDYTKAIYSSSLGLSILSQNNFDWALFYYNRGNKPTFDNLDGFLTLAKQILLGTRAQSYYYSKEWAKAIVDYYDAILLGGDVSHYYTKTAQCHMQLSQWNNAIIDFNKSIEADPYDKNAHHGLGIVYIKLNQKSKGCECLKKAYELGDIDALTDIKSVCK